MPTELELDREIGTIFTSPTIRKMFKGIVQTAQKDCPLCDGWGYGISLGGPFRVRFCACVDEGEKERAKMKLGRR